MFGVLDRPEELMSFSVDCWPTGPEKAEVSIGIVEPRIQLVRSRRVHREINTYRRLASAVVLGCELGLEA
ncbi:hypothetical protein BraRD5C2_67400 [Bradyrhizobium sp. RD5-C2]|nr:hypothetical protein BraRD5C2_67400 [Bradyrhizobium sp. RD5-C2]